MEKILRWGIIGCGDVVRRKSGGAFSIDGKSTLAGVFVRRETEKARQFAEAQGCALHVGDPDALVRSADAVYIATPPSSHFEYALQAIRQGKHVLVEKPVALSGMQCKTLLDEAAKCGVRLFPAFYRRALSPYLQVKAWLAQGRIGQVRQVLIDQRKRYPSAENGVPWRLLPEISGGGLFEDIGVHTLDMMDCLFGSCTDVKSIYVNQRQRFQPADTVSILASYGAVQAVGNWHLDSFSEKDEIELLGTDGTIRFSMLTDRGAVLETRQGREEAPPTEERWLHRPLVENLCDALSGRAEAVCSEQSALRVAALVEKIQNQQSNQRAFS